MYTNVNDVNELLEALRWSLAEHPAERDTLKAIATIARRDGLEAGIAAYEAWKRSRLANAPNDTAKLASPAASSPVPAHVSQPDDTSHTAATQNASGGITAQSTLSGEAGKGQSSTPEPTQTRHDAPDSPTCTAITQDAPCGITAQSTQPDKAGSQPDDAARLQAQIDGCLAMETDPALRLFLEQLRRDIHKYPVESVRQELEAYLQPGTPGDFLNRLAALHMSWALDDVAADPDGKRLVRGDTGGRKAILERIEAAFRAETEPVARCYLAKLARKAVSNPPGAGEGLEGYIDARTSPTWLWLAAVFVAGSPEAAFQWRLQEARRSTASAWLLGYLDKLEQEARESLPMAVSKLEAFIEILALLDNPTHTIPAQNAPETITDGAQPCAVA